jgi:DNA primase catalytic core
MARISDDELARLKKNISVVEVCKSRGIELKPNGRKDLIGKCPFHKEENPSFVVSPDKNLFHCMGCDAGGSVIDLVMKLDGIEFKEAVDKLLTSTPQVKRAVEMEKARPAMAPERATLLLEKVIATYEKTFAEVPEGRAYLEKRGITDAGLFTKHRIGYANGRLRELLPKDGKVWEELKAVGVLLENGQERFKDCVVVPVFNPEGILTTLYGRYVPAGHKRHVFLPERSTGLWNAITMKSGSDVVLVESVIDALSVMMAGHRNVIGIQGTNGLNDADIALMQGHGVQRVTLLLDGDEAGRKAAERLKEKLSASFGCRVVTLPDDDDPNSYLVKHGPEELAIVLNPEPGEEPAPAPQASSTEPAPSRSGSTLVINYGLRRYEVRGLEKGPRKLKATLRVEHSGRLHVDTLDFYSARARRALAVDLCRVFEESPETIEGDIEKLMRHCEGLPDGTMEPTPLPMETLIGPKDKAMAESFGKDGKLFENILADFESCGVIGEESNKLLGYIAMTSRKRDVPLSVLILSSSGAGKTALQDAICSFCPPEDMVKLTSLSGKALFYKERMSLKHKVLALEEGDGAEEASYAIRNLISARELVSESTIKDLATGRLVTMENKVEGPTAVFLTTTNPEIDAETKSRFFVTSVDESREQTRRILLFQRRLHQSDGLIASTTADAILKKHRNFQRLLKPLAVKNPYAGQLTYGDDRLQGRRDQPKYLNLIKAISFLRQMQKEVRHETTGLPFVVVDIEDIRLANQLAHDVLGHSLDELSRPGRDLLGQLGEMKGKRKTGKDEPQSLFSFSRRDIREYTGWSNTRLHIHLKELVDFEYVVVEAGRNGMPYRYRLVYDGQGKDGRKFMLGLKESSELQGPQA